MTPFWPNGAPIPVTDRYGVPQSFSWARIQHTVQTISAHWRVHTLWWTSSEIWRDYWEVTTDTNLLCVLYYDLLGERWYLERIYE